MKSLTIKLFDETFSGTPIEIVNKMRSNPWQQMLEKSEYIQGAAKRARIITGYPVRPWGAELFVKDLIDSGLARVVEG